MLDPQAPSVVPDPSVPPVGPPASPAAPSSDAVPYARFKEVNEARAVAEAAAKQGADDLKAAQELAAKQATDLAAEQLKASRLMVAIEKSLPLEIAERLQGKTLDEIRADADKVLPHLQRPAPGVPAV